MSSVVILLFCVSWTHVHDWYDYFNSRSCISHVTHISYLFQKKKIGLKRKIYINLEEKKNF